MNAPTKRVWTRPELIVIVRGKAEETVLDICKTSNTMGSTGQSSGDCASFSCATNLSS